MPEKKLSHAVVGVKKYFEFIRKTNKNREFQHHNKSWPDVWGNKQTQWAKSPK